MQALASPPAELTQQATDRPQRDQGLPEATRQLWTTLRVRPGVIVVASREEERVAESLSRFADKFSGDTPLPLYSWSVVTGLVPLKNNIPSGSNPDSMKPAAALDRALELADDTKGGILIFRDLHRHLDDPAVCRRIRECSQRMRGRRTQLVLVSPEIALPVDIRSDVAIVDFPLPGKEEMSELIDKRISELAGNPHGFVVTSCPRLREAARDALSGLTLDQADNALAHAVIENDGFTGDVVRSIQAAKRQAVHSTSCLEIVESSASLDDVGGLDRLKSWLTKRAICFTESARDFGIRAPRGVLALGVPGGGKSLAARATATTLGLPLLHFNTGAIYGGLLGESESNVRQALAVADAMGPCVLWIDEIEKGFGRPGRQSDGDTSQRVLGTLLTWMSERSTPVFMFATSNDVSQVPPELIRKGRFDEVFYVDLPNTEERREIVRIHLEKVGRDASSFDLERLAQGSSGFVGGEIEQAIQEALVNALAAGKEDITTGDIIVALSETVPMVRTHRESIEHLRGWADEGRVVRASSGERVELLR